MNCIVYDASEMLAIPELSSYIAKNMTKPGSDFSKKIADGTASGSIAVVYDNGVAGWVRTEKWIRESGEWDTIEGFVEPRRRKRGIASFAAMGLVAAEKIQHLHVAVFAWEMLMVAKKAGLDPKLFKRIGDIWVMT